MQPGILMNLWKILNPTPKKLAAFFLVYFFFQIIQYITYLDFGYSLGGTENVNLGSLVLYYLTGPFTFIQTTLVTNAPALTQSIAFILFPIINTLNVLWVYLISAAIVSWKEK